MSAVRADIKESAASSRHVRALKRLRDVLRNTRGFFDQEREQAVQQ